MFKRITAKKCSNPKCPAFQVVVDSALNVCEECADPLTAITAIDKRAVAIAVAAAVLVLGGGGYFGALKVKAYLAAKAVKTLEEAARPLSDAARAQVKALLQEIEAKGETADTRRRLDEFKVDYKLGPEELESLTREAQSEAVGTSPPKPESGDAGKELAKLLRSIYADGVKTGDEQAKLDDLSRKYSLEVHRVVQLEQEIKDRLSNSEMSLKQGLQYVSGKQFSQAVKEFKHSVDVDPDNAFAWSNLASAYLNLDDQEQARAACDKALTLDSRNWLAHYNLGSLYATNGDKDAAIRELNTALEMVAADKYGKITRGEIASQMKTDRLLVSLRGDSRFQQLLALN